jgi:hypothetical protein
MIHSKKMLRVFTEGCPAFVSDLFNSVGAKLFTPWERLNYKKK